MISKKKKSIKKKAVKKATKKVVKRAAKKQKRVKKVVEPGVIFDSQIGKTDALFVSEPELAVKPDNPQQLDPAINEALQEIDALENQQKAIQPQQIPQQPEPLPQKKSFWQRFFKR